MLLLSEVAKEQGYKVEWVDRWSGYLLRINGKYFGNAIMPKFPLNSATASGLVRDKVFSYLILEEAGIRVPRGDYFFKYNPFYDAVNRGKGEAEALKFAEKLGYPLIAKPNSLSLGRHCRLVTNRRALQTQLQAIWQEDHIALIQQRVTGREWRVVVLDGEIILAYEKEPGTIVGDGRRTVLSLMKQQQKKISNLVFDGDYLSLQGYKTGDVLEKGEKLYLAVNANLSTGGHLVQLEKSYPRVLQDFCRQLADLFGLRLYGLDLMAQELRDDQSYTVIEINSDPGFGELAKFNYGQTKEIMRKILARCF
jgi:D-alanine-D-alanine ligase-like ATP-grasp enzyme